VGFISPRRLPTTCNPLATEPTTMAPAPTATSTRWPSPQSNWPRRPRADSRSEESSRALSSSNSPAGGLRKDYDAVQGRAHARLELRHCRGHVNPIILWN
jgi:hypothetical protein